MGMYCSMHRLTSAEIEQLIADPSRMDAMLGFDKAPPMREVRPKGILGLRLRLTPVTIHEVDPSAKEFADLQSFVKRAAAAGDGLVIHVS